MSETDVLVLGGPAAGKTHYAGQLLGRLRYDRQGVLRLRAGGADNLMQLQEVLSCLEEGRSAGHTPAETWVGVKLHLERRGGTDVVLEWPDYAGERLASIVERRVLPPEWRGSVHASRGWMLLIRPSTLKLHEDLLSRPAGYAPQHTVTSQLMGGSSWDDRARYVELLQILLFAAGHSTHKQITCPRLAVVLSCWDELGACGTPEEVFQDRLPLLNAYIRNTWAGSGWSVWGLSSLGRELRPDVRDTDFVVKGPEQFGFVVPPGRTDHLSDLTAPVAWLLEV